MVQAPALTWRARAQALLDEVGHFVPCDICPSYRLSVGTHNSFTIDILGDSDTHRWYYVNENIHQSVIRQVRTVIYDHSLEKLSADQLCKMKKAIGFILVRAAQKRSLYRVPK